MDKKNILWYDLDGSLLQINAKWWIIDKNNPENYIIKITQEEGSLILSGIHKGNNNKISYNGLEGWLSDDVFKRINAVKKIKLEDIGISFREFSDEEFLTKQSETINFLLHNIEHLKNEVISILTARGSKKLHDKILSKLENTLDKELNIKIDKVYFISDNDLSRHNYQPALKKSIIILEHMIGFRIDNLKFVEIEQESYITSSFFDDEKYNIDVALNMQELFIQILNNTKDNLKKEIIEYVNNNKPKLITYLITNNKVNPFIKNELTLSI